MAKPRLDLHTLLVAITPHVYFQPPTNSQMQFPCIMYKKDADDTKSADNKKYSRFWRYEVTVVDEDPDSAIPDVVAQLPMCAFQRHFTADNLNHYVFNLFF